MLWTVLNNSVVFSLLFAGVMLVKALFGKQLSARLHYMIWAAVIASLLVPIRIVSGISVWNLLPKQTTESILQQTKHLQPAKISGNDAYAAGEHKTVPNAVQPHVSAGPAVAPARNDLKNHPGRAAWPAVAYVIWLAGMAAVLLWQFLGGLRLRRQLIRCGSTKVPPWLDARAKECAAALNLRRNVCIAVQPVLPIPAVIGVFQPILAMPESTVEDGPSERARHILMHEFCHVRRGDLAVIALMNLLSAIYWFHPLVWLCFNRIRADMETCCDNVVVDVLGTGKRQEYIRTLVHFSGMSGHARAQTALSLNDAGIKMKNRIGAMFMIQKTKPTVLVPVILLVFVLTLAAFAVGCLPTVGGGAASADPSAITPNSTTAAPETPAGTLPGTLAPSPEASATPVAATTAPAKTAGTEPSGLSDWEAKYQPVLDQYRAFAKRFAKQGDSVGDFTDMGDPWGLIAPDMAYSSRKLGYGFRDLDGNGTPELFLLTSDGSVWAMYTFVDGAPKLMDSFWARNACFLDKSDAVYTNWSSGAMDNGMDVYRISKDGRSLVLVKRVAMESSDETGKPLDEPRYYQCEGSEKNKQIITKAKAEAETSKFPKTNDDSGLEFVPLG